MKEGNIISLAAYKAEHLYGTTRNPTDVESKLPESDTLWELLDRNINVKIWTQANQAQQ